MRVNTTNLNKPWLNVRSTNTINSRNLLRSGMQSQLVRLTILLRQKGERWMRRVMHGEAMQIFIFCIHRERFHEDLWNVNWIFILYARHTHRLEEIVLFSKTSRLKLLQGRRKGGGGGKFRKFTLLRTARYASLTQFSTQTVHQTFMSMCVELETIFRKSFMFMARTNINFEKC